MRVSTDVLGYEWPAREALQEFAAVLSAESAFTGMSWHDVKHAIGGYESHRRSVSTQ